MLKKFVKFLLVIILVLAIYVVGNGASVYLYSYIDETRKADVAVVLGASVAYNRVSAVYRERINISKGVNKNDILIEESSKTTLENLIYAKKLMNENDLKSALIVSDALHMRRAMLMAKDEGIDAYSSPTKTSMFKTTKKRVEFLRNETVEYILYKCYKVVQHFTDINV